MAEAQKAQRRKTDPKWIDPDGMTEEEYQAAMDKMWPRLAEPDEEGFDLNPTDPRRRVCMTCEGVTFSQASQVTEEEKAEVETMWEAMTDGDYSPAKTKKEKETHPKKAWKKPRN